MSAKLGTTTFKWLSELLKRSDSPLALKALQKIFDFKIPFNGPHGIKIKKITQAEAVAFLPNKRSNKNHLGTIHACAMATLGEFPAGLLLIKNLDAAKFRVVMTKLEASYLKRATTSLRGVCKTDEKQIREVLDQLNQGIPGQIQMSSQIIDDKDQIVANILTSWQLKAWDQIKAR